MRCESCREFLDLEGGKYCPSCGATIPEPPPDPLIGQLVSRRYTIKSLVAEGGMGRVYSAEQPMGEMIRKVAIKVLLAEYSGRELDMQRFSRECSTVAELEHPNTIKFYDYGETDDGDLFIAMEFLAGQSLSQALKEGPISPERVDLIIGQICGSLQEAHDHGIVHRDLKPDNIILTSPGGQPDFVKVLDFGIAKRIGGKDPKLTPLGVVLGSPPYMSPEQFTLQDIDARSDIYSLGVLAFQALTGKLPFQAQDPMEWAHLHMNTEPLSFDSTEAGPYVPDHMRRGILMALAKDPQNRPQTMREFYAEFTLGTGTLPPGRLPSVLPLSHDLLSMAAAHSSVSPMGGSVRPPSSPPRGSLVAPRPMRAGSAPPGSVMSRPSPPSAVSPRSGITPQSGSPPQSAFPRRSAMAPPSAIAPRSGSSEPRFSAALSSSAPLGSKGLERDSNSPESDEAPTAIREGMTNETSMPEISFNEMSGSELDSFARTPFEESSSLDFRVGKLGTVVMAASEAPPDPLAGSPGMPRPRMTMPDLLPPTVRDPQGMMIRQASALKSKRYVIAAVLLIAIGSIAGLLAWFLGFRPTTDADTHEPAHKPKRVIPDGPQTHVEVPTSAPATSVAQPVPQASASSAPANASDLSPCQVAVFSAVSGKCDVAKRSYARCAPESPYAPSAARAMSGLCP